MRTARWSSLRSAAPGSRQFYGGFAREPFTDESREYVFITRKR
jgi:hypothetical protein